MGYTTDFSGSLTLSRKLTEKEKDYINTFSGTRRMRRDVKKLMEKYNGKYGYPFPELLSGKVMHNTAETIYGNEGEYFAMDDGQFGQTHDDTIIDYNEAPGHIPYAFEDFNKGYALNRDRVNKGLCQPGLWCKWIIASEEDGDFLEWSGAEKFYDYVEWLKYLIAHFFSKWGVELNGEIDWQGEDPEDMGKIVVKNNKVKTKIAKITFVDSEDEE